MHSVPETVEQKVNQIYDTVSGSRQSRTLIFCRLTNKQNINSRERIN